MDWNDLTIGLDEAEFPRILKTCWGWLLTKPYQPVLMTALGDWFLEDEAGRYFFLDMLEGNISHLADSLQDLNGLLQEEEHPHAYFMAPFVVAMQRAGKRRARGQTYAYTIHPIIGGKIETANLMLLPIETWQIVCGQLHQQVKQMKPGTQIVGMESPDGRTIRLITDEGGVP